MTRDDHVELTRLLLTMHATVALVVAAGGLLLRGGRLPVRGAWSDGRLGIVGSVLVAAGVLVILLAAVASASGRPGVVHGCGLAVALVSAVTVVPLATVLGLTGWAAVAALPLLTVSLPGVRPWSRVRVGRAASPV